MDIGADERPENAPASAATILVSGGGSALQDAIDEAGACTVEIVITDSLDYDPIVLSKALTIRADGGESPTCVSNNGSGKAAIIEGDGRRRPRHRFGDYYWWCLSRRPRPY